MAKSILLNAQTERQLALFIGRPSHALMISGPTGSGKRHVAEYLAAKLLKLADLSKLDAQPYFSLISRPNGRQEIGLEQVKQIGRHLRLKTAGTAAVRRLVIIENAELMSLEAQNALLKILEEPPADSLIILTVTSPRSVLPTIASRAQQLQVQAVDLESAQAFLEGRYSAGGIETAWRLAAGRPGLMLALLASNQTHPLKQAVADAKKLLTQPLLARIAYLDKLGRSRADLHDLLDGLNLIMTSLHHASIHKAKTAQASKLLANRQLIRDSLTHLEANTQPRLVALKLALSLKS